jgi:Trypsin-co-occurring domain 1
MVQRSHWRVLLGSHDDACSWIRIPGIDWLPCVTGYVGRDRVAVRVVEVVLPNEGVSGTLEGIAQAVRSGLEKVIPSKTTVQLGIELAVKNGKLTGLIVEGDASASLNVTLEWDGKADASAPSA